MSNSFFIFILLGIFTNTLLSQNDSDFKGALNNADSIIIIPKKRLIDESLDSAYMWRVQQTHLDEVYIPLDLYDCFKELDKLMDDKVRERFMSFSDEEVDKRTHGSLGIWLDVKWQITEGSRLTYYFRKMGVPHPQYMIGIIITSYYRYLHKKDLKVKEQLSHFKELWEEKKKERATELLNQKTPGR